MEKLELACNSCIHAHVCKNIYLYKDFCDRVNEVIVTRTEEDGYVRTTGIRSLDWMEPCNPICKNYVSMSRSAIKL